MKRMKDAGYRIWKMFDKYGPHDSRYWTMLIDPGGYSIWVTCHFNKDEINDVMFELDDGGNYIPRRLMIKTASIETIISNLYKFKIDNQPFDSSLIEINNEDDRQTKKRSEPETTEATSP